MEDLLTISGRKRCVKIVGLNLSVFPTLKLYHHYNIGNIHTPLSQFYSFKEFAEIPQKRAFSPLHFFYFSLQCGYCHTRKTQIGRDVL